MSRIINKLVAASGGWEKFLYQTLKDVCEKVGTNGFTGDGEDSIEEAVEILEAYEEMGWPNVVTPAPGIETQDQAAVELQKHNIKLTPTLETKDITDPPKVEVPKPIPKRLIAKIAVDNEVGASQGGLPIPLGHVIVNRENLVITTVSGAQLGMGSFDGQIKGSDVSGHIRVDGTYRLVFKDVNCGVGIVKFEVVQNGKNDE